MSFIDKIRSFVTPGNNESQKINKVNPKYSEFKDTLQDDESIQRNSVLNYNYKGADTDTVIGNNQTARAYADFVYAGVTTNKMNRLSAYRKMAMFPEVGNAIDEICDASINKDENSNICSIKFNLKERNDVRETEITEQFDNFISLFNLDFNFFDYMRTLIIDGEVAWENITDSNNKEDGIIGVNFIPTESYEFLVTPTGVKKGIVVSTDTNLTNKSGGSGYIAGGAAVQSLTDFYKSQQDKKDNSSGKDTATLTEIKGIPLPFEQITYVDSGLYTSDKLIVYPVLEKAKKAYRQLTLIEDAIVIYRLVRAPERLVFNVDVGKMNGAKAEQEVMKLMRRFQNKKFYNPETGTVSNDYDPHSILENYWFAKGEGNTGTTVTTIGGSGAAQWASLPDLEYFLEKLYTALKVPMSRFKESKLELNKSATISYEEYRFAKFVMRLLNRFSAGLKKSFMVHLALTGLKERYDINEQDFNIVFAPPTSFELYESQKLLKIRYENYDTVTKDHPELSKELAMKKILNMNETEIIQNRIMVEKEALENASLEFKKTKISSDGTYIQPLESKEDESNNTEETEVEAEEE